MDGKEKGAKWIDKQERCINCKKFKKLFYENGEYIHKGRCVNGGMSKLQRIKTGTGKLDYCELFEWNK